jgi:hypothetical protein
MKEYCVKCGSKLVKEFNGYYDLKTGKKCFRSVCSKNPCEHSGHTFVVVPEKSWFKGLFLDDKFHCLRCHFEVRWGH